MSNYNDFCPDDCPVDCSAVLVAVPAFGCMTPNDEKITELFWSNAPLTAGDLEEWDERLDNTTTDTALLNLIRSLAVEGNLPRVDAQFKKSRNGQASVPLEVDREISFFYEDDADTTFAFFKNFECGMTKRFWFRSGGHIYGGLEGIHGTLLSNYEINDASEGMAHNWEVKLQFKSKCFPSRVAAVI